MKAPLKFSVLTYVKNNFAFGTSPPCASVLSDTTGPRTTKQTAVGIMTCLRAEDARILVWLAAASAIIVIVAAALAITPMLR
jgi:hypothetical protein